MPYTVVAENAQGQVPAPYPMPVATETALLGLLQDPPRWARVLRVTEQTTGTLVLEGFARPSMDLMAPPVLIAHRVPDDWWQVLAASPRWMPEPAAPAATASPAAAAAAVVAAQRPETSQLARRRPAASADEAPQ